MKSEVNINCVEAGGSTHTKEEPESPLVDPIVQQWPTDPKPLVLTKQDQLFYTAYDIALISLPVLLMVKTGLCIYAHHYDRFNTGTSIDSASFMSRALINFNSQLVTLFTIVFVTIVSTFVKRLALWKAQRGAYIADLEQYQGSISLPSTLKLVWSLRSFGLKSVLLVLAWSFYYLGSQAVKLEYQLSLSDNFQKLPTAIQRSDAPSFFDADLNITAILADRASNTDQTTVRPGTDSGRLNTYFSALILDTSGSGTSGGASQDKGSRNGPLMPNLDSAVAAGQSSIADKVRYKLGGWVATSQRSKLDWVTDTGTTPWTIGMDKAFSNGVHLLFAGKAQILGSYTMHNISYMNISCADTNIMPASAFPNLTDATTSVSLNMSVVKDTTPRDTKGHPLREFVYSYRGWFKNAPNGTDPATEVCPLSWDPEYTYSQRTAQTVCTVSTKYVDLQVSCLATGCYPVRMRWSNQTDESGATSYSTPFDSDVYAANFLDNFIRSTGPQSTRNAITLVESEYIQPRLLNDTYWSALGPLANQANDYYQINLGDQGLGLTRGINSYHTLSQLVVAEQTTPDFNVLIGAQSKTNPNPQDIFFTLIDADGAFYNQAYRINWVWIPIDFVACTILLAAAIGSFWLRVHTLAPDIFGFVSSLTRGNPHIQLPSEGSTLGGIERARMLKGVKVKLGDVQEVTAENGTVGTVGLAPVQASGVQPLRSAGVYQ